MSIRIVKTLLFRLAFVRREIERAIARRGQNSMRLLRLKSLQLRISNRLREVFFSSFARRELQPVRVRSFRRLRPDGRGGNRGG